jgi:hypothetical protein
MKSLKVRCEALGAWMRTCRSVYCVPPAVYSYRGQLGSLFYRLLRSAGFLRDYRDRSHGFPATIFVQTIDRLPPVPDPG